MTSTSNQTAHLDRHANISATHQIIILEIRSNPIMPVLDIQNALSRRDTRFSNQPNTGGNGSSPNLISSLIPSKIPVPIMVGAAVGACVVAIVGAMVYRNRVRSFYDKGLASTTAKDPLSLAKNMRRKQDNQSTDQIAQIGINLNRQQNSSIVSNDDCPTPTNKPKLLSMMKQLPFNKKQSVLDSGPMKAVVIPRRKESISTDGPLNLDNIKRHPSNGGNLSKVAHRKSSPLTPHDTPSDTVNKVLESMGNSLSKATDSASSSLSSVSTIESDTEVEHRFEVIEPWMPQRYDELELLVGDTVIVYQMFEDGWCDGKLEGSDESGAFPAACLQMDDWSVHAEPSIAPSPTDANEMDLGGSENSIPDVDIEQASRHSHYSSRSGTSVTREFTRDSSSSGTSTNAVADVSVTSFSRSDPAKHRFSGLLRNIDKFIEEPDAQQPQ
ncbi:hypothetical protein HDU78_009854 [Chytriomyces hyalinus]|nr:hypothetical protein HDU78_009854 [Chytriomyces hyalinus]